MTPPTTPSPAPAGLTASRRFLLPALFVGALFATLWMRRPADVAPVRAQSTVYVFEGPTMGTTYRVKLVATNLDEGARVAAARVVADALETVNRGMSTYRPDSELSRFNAHRAGPFAASASLRGLIADASALSERSGGAFDVTVGPLVNAWGFGPGRGDEPPSDEAIAALMAKVGYQKVKIDDAAATLEKLHPEVYVDLSAIAKGYGVDQAAAALEGLGYHDYLVEVGGELRARGHNPKGEIWRIGVERPEPGVGQGLHAVVPLKDTGMATSGDYRNYYERDGVRISHTIDPRTGRPISHRLASVTVLHPRCALADAWATTLNVLGPLEGPALAEAEGLAALFIIRRADGGYETRATSAFPTVSETAP